MSETVNTNETTEIRVVESALHLDALLREAASARAFDVTIIRAGKSLNRIQGRHLFYAEELLRASASVFENAPVRMIQLGEVFDHTPDGVDKDTLSGNIIGVLEGVHYADGELRARLVLHEGATFAAGVLKLSVERSSSGHEPLVGLSIDAMGHVQFVAHESGEEIANVTSLTGPASVDVVHRPAAGGAIRRLAASIQKETKMPDLKTPPPDGGSPSPAVPAKESAAPAIDLDARLKEAEEQRKRDLAAFEAKLAESEKKFKCGALLATKLAESKLPDEAREEIRESFADRVFEVADLDAKIEKFRKILAAVDKSGDVHVPGRAEVVREAQDRWGLALEGLFLGNTPYAGDVKKRMREAGTDPIYSFRSFVQQCTGHDVLDFYFGRGGKKKLTESLQVSSWTDVFGDTLHKAFIKIYVDPADQDWRKVVRVVPLSSFETQHRIRVGGYGNLSVVAERQNYPALTSPGDEEAEYAAQKRGGTEDLTMEMMLADQIGAIAEIPMKMAIAARRTLKEFVLDFFTIAGQPTCDYDSTTLFHSNHANLLSGSYAFSADNLSTAVIAMKKQTELSSSKRLGGRVIPKFLLHPVDLGKLVNDALEIVTTTGEDPSAGEKYVRKYGIQPIEVDYWTNTTDYILVADPMMFPAIEIGFVGGREEPQLVVQDGQSVGSMFDRDSTTWKISHAYGGDAVDHRGVYAVDSSA